MLTNVMTKPAKCISNEKSKEIQKNWNETRALAIKEKLGFEDSREFVFSIDEMIEYLEFVKNESLTQGILNPGVRINFAAYDDDKSNKATIFLSPTLSPEMDAENNYDIECMNTVIGGWPPHGYGD